MVTTLRAHRREVVMLCAAVGVALSVAGFAWYGHAYDDRCGTNDERTLFALSVTLAVVGPYLGCLAVPVAWKRTAEHRIVKAALFGFVPGLLALFGTAQLLRSLDDDGSLFLPDVTVFVFVLLSVLALLRYWSAPRPGQLGGFALGFTTPLLLFPMLAWADICSY